MKTKLIVALLILCLLPLNASAQGSTPPLLVSISKSYGHDELWAWSADAFDKITDLPFGVSPLAISPDGQWAAYSAYSQQVTDDLLHGGGQSGAAPTDIWLLDLTKHTASQITEQPKQINGATIYQNGWLRTRPVWSPDDKFLSWLKGRADGGDGEQLVAYDVARHLVNVVATGLDKGAPAVGDVLWGGPGIAVNDFLGSSGDKIIRVYSQQGLMIFSKRVTNEQAMFWAKGPLRDTLVLIDGLNNYVRLVFATGAEEQISGPYRSTSSDSIFKIYGLQNAARLSGPGQQTIPLVDESLVALSPDGQSAAYIARSSTGKSTFTVLDKAGTTTDVQAPGDILGLSWAATNWYLPGE